MNETPDPQAQLYAQELLRQREDWRGDDDPHRQFAMDALTAGAEALTRQQEPMQRVVRVFGMAGTIELSCGCEMDLAGRELPRVGDQLQCLSHRLAALRSRAERETA